MPHWGGGSLSNRACTYSATPSPQGRCIPPKNQGRHLAGLDSFCISPLYVVARGLTQITVAGTTPVVAAGSLHPRSAVALHAGTFGLICGRSCSVVVSP